MVPGFGNQAGPGIDSRTREPGVITVAFSLESVPGFLVDKHQSVSKSEAVTYTQTGEDDVTGVSAVFGETTHEQIDNTDHTLVEATSRDFVFKATELDRTPQVSDTITRGNGEVYRVMPFGEDEQCYRQRGEMLRVFTRRASAAN